MKDADDSADDTGFSGQINVLRLVHIEKRESLLPDPRLKALIDEMKGKQKPKRVRLTLDDGPEAA